MREREKKREGERETQILDLFFYKRVAVCKNSIKNNEVILSTETEILKLPEFYNCYRNPLVKDI